MREKERDRKRQFARERIFERNNEIVRKIKIKRVRTVKVGTHPAAF